MLREGEIEGLINKRLDHETVKDAPAYIVFTIYDMINAYDTNWYDKRYIVINSTIRKFMDRTIVLERFHARLYRAYPNCRISVGPVTRREEVKQRNELLHRRTVLRGKITKATNKLKRWEDYQATLLINELGSEGHLLVKSKIEEFKTELIQVQNEIDNNKKD